MKDKQVETLIKKEKARQNKVINLIPSDNHSSDDVFEALGSCFSNKYSEGYPGHRYYGGQEFTDKLELLAQKRALEAFKLSPNKWHVNVQPLSGSPANLAVYMGLLGRTGKIMGMSLRSGGHLTHGHKVSATGIYYKQIPFEVDPKTERLNYNSLKKQAKAKKPDVIVAGFTAYPRKIDFKKFREIADACGAYLMVDMSHIAGLIAGGVHPSPFPYADVVTTTTHKTLRGPRGAIIFAKKDKRELYKKIDKAIFPGLQGGPHMNKIAAIAVAMKEAKSPSFKKYAKNVVENTKVLADELKKHGWRICSSGTDNHLLLVDVWMDGKGVSGGEAERKLEKAGIIVNKNTIPGETRGPFDPSGIRLGAAEVTTRGMGKKDMVTIAKKIDKALRS
ncbi:MAG: serine hydroxymethyltransferase [Candidatus Pacebacteria bacterium]|nr:serine hydroxymethyltransferase [Candidatus Paceibacterota bacterium]